MLPVGRCIEADTKAIIARRPIIDTFNACRRANNPP